MKFIERAPNTYHIQPNIAIFREILYIFAAKHFIMYNQLEDKELVKLLIQTDSEDSFCELYTRYRRRLHLFCLTFIKIPEVAEDVVQEVFTAVWTGRKCLNPELPFTSYLYMATRNRMLNFLRQANQDMQVKEKLQSAGNPIYDYADLNLQEKEYNQLLEQAIKEMPPLRQQIFRLSRVENKSHKEIAQQLKISPYTVQENISGALKSIKVFLTLHADIHLAIWILLFHC